MQTITTQVMSKESKATVEALLQQVAAAFRFDRDETERFVAKPLARLIASLPFLAGCDHPERTAVEHLGVYVLSCRQTREAFYATPGDDRDVYARLEAGMHFSGGDQAIVDRGMALIALTMVNDYVRDVTVDRVLGKHNPVATGAWDASELIERLTAQVNAVRSPEMDAIFSLEAGTLNWWNAL